MTTLLQEEQDLQDFLTAYGFTVERLNTQQDARTCDFKVTAGGIDYLIEVKRRDNSAEYLESMRETQSYSGSKELNYSSSIEGIVKNAVAQFNETPSPARYRIIWLKLSCDFPDVALAEVKISLYGIRILTFEKANTKFEMDCYYLAESIFYKFKQLDAVILHTETGLIFFINDHANYPYHLLQSPLFQLLKREDGLVFPAQMDEERRCILADCDIPRKQVQDIFIHLEKKYGIRIQESAYRKEYFGTIQRKVGEIGVMGKPQGLNRTSR